MVFLNLRDKIRVQKTHQKKFSHPHAQSTLEFTFGMIVTVLFMVGMIRVFAWTGQEVIDRRTAHERLLTKGICQEAHCPLLQIRPRFKGITDMDAVWDSNIYGTN